MKVKRIDIFDYEITVTEKQFGDIKRIADGWEISIERAISSVIDRGIGVLLQALENKE